MCVCVCVCVYIYISQTSPFGNILSQATYHVLGIYLFLLYNCDFFFHKAKHGTLVSNPRLIQTTAVRNFSFNLYIEMLKVVYVNFWGNLH